MRWISWVIASLVLAACQNPAAEAKKQAQAEISICHSQYPRQPGTMHARESCILNIFENSPYAPPLETASVAKAVVWAQQVDSGQMSMDQFTSLTIQEDAQVREQEHEDALQQEAVNAQRAAAFAAIMQATTPPPAPTPVYIQPPILPRPVTTNCMQNGNMTSCQSY